MIIRSLLVTVVALGAATTAFAAEESSTSGERLQQGAPGRPIYRPGPPPSRPAQPPPSRPAEPYRPAPPQVYRQAPPPPPHIYRPAPAPVYRPRAVEYGYTCVTRRFSCDLSRPAPVGADCDCRAPWGGYKSGTVE